MQLTVVPGVSMWSVWQPDRKLFFNSHLVETSGGTVAIDPLPFGDADAADVAARGLAWIAITNRDHERDARALAARTGARIAASAADAAQLSGAVDRALHDGDDLCGMRVVALDGLKTPGEIALHLPWADAVVLGDALWGAPAGALRLMPDDKLADPSRAVLSLRRVRALLPEHLLLGDGTSIFGGAHRVLQTYLESRTDAYVNRINAADAPWQPWIDEPAPFGGASRIEIGDLIGAERLGYRLVRLPPGVASCPTHWHGAEEELFVVLRGRALLHTPRGELTLETGDYVAFPTRPSGAHKIVASGDEPCEVLMVANTDPYDVCYYPDSHKVLVEKSDLLVRDRPQLDYFDGEV